MSQPVNDEAIPVLEVQADAPPTVSVGQQLRQWREARGMELPDVAQTLKLGLRQIEALERGDWDMLPGPTFIRGFVRNYARLLEADATPLMAQLDHMLAKPVNALAAPDVDLGAMPHSGGGLSRRDRGVVLAGVGLVAVASLIYFLLPNDLSALRDSTQSLLDNLARKEVVAPPAAPAAEPEPVFPPGSTPQQIMNPALEPASPPPAPLEAPAASAALPAAVAAVAAAPATPEAKAPQAGAPQMRFVFDKQSWVEVRDRDDKVVFSQRMIAGSERSLSGQGPLTVVIGYAPGVQLFWRGETIDLLPHTRGDVARLVLE